MCFFFFSSRRRHTRCALVTEFRRVLFRSSGELVGVIVSLGGQTPLKLSGALPKGLVLGTSPESIDLAEDRERWNALCERLEIPQPAGGTATTVDQAQTIAERIGYPVLMRPPYAQGRSEEHTSERPSTMSIPDAVFRPEKKT